MTLQSEGIPFFNFIESFQSWEMYLLKMERPGTWGTRLELQALSNMLDVTFCIVTNSSVEDESIIWLYPILKGITYIDAPVQILGCEMEFHYHSLVPIMSADSHFRLPNKRFSNETTASGNSKSISYCDVNKGETCM